MDKKQLVSECKAVKKILQGMLTASNKRFSIKEKVNNFFDKLLDYLNDADTATPEEDKFNQHPRTIEKNLEFLKKRFSKEPNNPDFFSENDKKNGLQILEECFKKEFSKTIKKDESDSS